MDFHAGTYVELLSGETGYIQNIYPYSNGQTLITVHYLTPDYLNGQDLIIVKEKDAPLAKFFSRVGCTLLSSKETRFESIEPLNLIGGFVGATERKISSKVDELIKAVNKINEQLTKER